MEEENGTPWYVGAIKAGVILAVLGAGYLGLRYYVKKQPQDNSTQINRQHRGRVRGIFLGELSRKEEETQMPEEDNNTRKGWRKIGYYTLVVATYLAVIPIGLGVYYLNVACSKKTSSEVRRVEKGLDSNLVLEKESNRAGR